MDIKKRFTVVFSAVIVLMITACARDGFSQWVSDTTKNTPVCTASNAQQHPKACTDGRDGIIIVWEDFRNNHWDVYAQKLDYGGYAQWTSNGVQLCQNNNTKTQPVIATDGSGGAYVVWLEQRRGSGQLDLYGQHILSNGSLGYGTKGFAVDSVPNTPESATSPANAAICEDDNGNAFVVWEDNRTAITLSSRPDIYGNFLTSSGPAWGKSGAPVIAFTSRQNTPKIIPDGNGGAYLAWISGANVPQSIQVTRLNNSGYSTWGNNGVEVYAGANGTADISRNPSLTRDGNQLVISWETLNSSNSAKGYDVYANRFSSSGTPIWGSASSPVSISNNWNGDQTNSIIFTDDSVVSSTGNSGIMVVYQNDASKNAISMTRVIGDGSTDVPAYPNHIFTVCYENASDGSVANQTNPVAVKTGTGEILAAWVDGRLSTSSTTVSSIYAQRLDKTPRRYLGPNPS
ncbi:MAG TPA: hypothetical protein VEW28_04050, partial [Candidatus Kapabacteria bacterium]|nr:hypothetical protein [Candidatus Kapabacteria bacterium]